MKTEPLNDLEKWIAQDEGLKLTPYLDTVEKLTIGFGRNLYDVGITREEAIYLMRNDIARCKAELAPYAWYVNQPEGVQMALLNMCFNIGIGRLLGFRKMIMALTIKDYTEAALEALDSKWATQVGQRAKDVAVMIREGK